MIRFVPIGKGTAQVLEAVAHDKVGAAQVVDALEKLRPARLFIDVSPGMWSSIIRSSKKVDPVEDVVAGALNGQDGIAPYALYRAVYQWAQRNQCEVTMLLGTLKAPKRKTVRAFKHIMAGEPLSAAASQRAIDEIRGQVLPRVPELQDWFADRAVMMTRQLALSFAAGQDGVAIMAYPDSRLAADLAQRT